MTRWLFDLGWFALIAFIAATAGALPEFVGRDAGLPREAYLALMLGAAVVVPWFATRGGLALGRRFPRTLSLPYKDYWFAPARREQSFAWLRGHCFLLGLALLPLFALVHYDALRRVHTDWPQPGPTVWLIGGGALGTVFVYWIGALRLRFHAPLAEAPAAAVAAGARRWSRGDELVLREVQPLWVLLWLTPPMLALPLLAPGGADLPEAALYWIVLMWLLVLASTGRFVVELHGDRLEWRFGWLWRPRWKLALDDIAKVEVVRTRPREGWGIRFTAQGMLYNAHGLDAVRIVRRDGRALRIGTREPRRLAEALGARL